MIIDKIPLRDCPTEYGFMPTMSAHILEYPKNVKRPCVVVFPGGGYSMVCTDREGERIALSYNAAGYNTVIVDYCVEPHHYPEPLRDAAAAVRITREHAEEWGIDENMIAVCGFSAGGHLAASLSTLWNNPEVFSEEEIKSGISKPNASVLIYGVLSLKPGNNRPFIINYIGKEDEKLLKLLACDEQVNGETPPAFIAQTYADRLVTVDNALCYADAMRKASVPFEMHIFPNGDHGISLASDETIWSKPIREREYNWMKLSIDWINELFGIIK